MCLTFFLVVNNGMYTAKPVLSWEVTYKVKEDHNFALRNIKKWNMIFKFNQKY